MSYGVRVHQKKKKKKKEKKKKKKEQWGESSPSEIESDGV